MSRALPTPATTVELVKWWVVVIVVSTSALVVTDRVVRRLLPLSVLLKLSLPFPDAPPSRIRLAIRNGSPRQLERWEAEVSARGSNEPRAMAAHELLGLVAALSSHDRRSRGHAERVRVYTDLMAEQLGLSKDDSDKLRWASLLHDIGKLQVSGAILNKRGVPDEPEWERIRRHPGEGDRLIEPLRAWLGPWSKAVVEHHERWDGHGYPNGLAGMDISLAGRIVAVTDSYEVMTATRSYKRPMSARAARQELTRMAGTQFDPAMVRAFLNIPIGRLSWVAAPIAWLAQLPFLAQIPTWGATAIVATGVVTFTPVISDVPLPFRAAPVVQTNTVDDVSSDGITVTSPHGFGTTTTIATVPKASTAPSEVPSTTPTPSTHRTPSTRPTPSTPTTPPSRTTTTISASGNGRPTGP